MSVEHTGHTFHVYLDDFASRMLHVRNTPCNQSETDDVADNHDANWHQECEYIRPKPMDATKDDDSFIDKEFF